MLSLEGSGRQPRVVVVVEGGSRQLIGIVDKDHDTQLSTGELTLINPLQLMNAPPQQTNGDGFAMGPLLITSSVEEMLVDVTSIIDIEVDSKLYRKYFLVGEEIAKQQQAMEAGLSLAREMPKGGIIGGR